MPFAKDFQYSPDAMKMTEEDEGLRLTAYQDTGGIWTIGFGHVGPEVHEGLVWTLQQAVDAFNEDIGNI